MDEPTTFGELFERATGGQLPYPYQQRLADQGLPELLEVPTGCGKTAAVVLAWLWRRRCHPDPAIRDSTPRRLVYVLPQRSLVEQVAREVNRWLESLPIADDLSCWVLMGGAGRSNGAWRIHPERDAIIVATQDMALSAALNRRYGETRWSWPIDFGLLNNDCAYVFDEIQLMGPGLPTSRQLDGLRHALGTAVDSTSTWMSATVDDAQLATVDRPEVASRATLGDADRTGSIALRLNATRQISQLHVPAKSYAKDLAAKILAAHRPGTRTIAVLNTVQRATDLKRALDKLTHDGIDVVLVHSRFRPDDRRRHLNAALAEPSPAGGTIVVSTQVLEAGIDVTSETMFTEAAPWSSVVQRAGRCNRDGRASDARLLWAAPPQHHPYEQEAVAACVAALGALEGERLSTEALAGRGPAEAPPVHPILRRRDLLELFDTLPDLSGSDIDVTRFIRDADERDIAVAWEPITADGPADDHPLPAARARCSVPLSDAKQLLEGRRCWRHDHIAGRWVVCSNPRDLRPGMVVLVDAASGGYDAELGWDRTSKKPVATVDALDAPASGLATDTNVDADPLSTNRTSWVGLVSHLQDVEREATLLDDQISPRGLTSAQRRAAIVAGRLHDLGKAHPVFQDTLRRSARDDTERAAAEANGPPWAKSAGSAQARHERRHFRHELASALALLNEGSVAIDDEEERDLIVYLVAAHHGRVRLGFRPMPNEAAPPPELDGRPVALGVVDGEMLPSVDVPGMTLPPSEMDLSVMQLGSGVAGQPSWAQRMLPLRDRADLGPFRLGFLEALVRMADWRASAAPGSGSEVLP